VSGLNVRDSNDEVVLSILDILEEFVRSFTLNTSYGLANDN
jgi:hypothetical protein